MSMVEVWTTTPVYHLQTPLSSYTIEANSREVWVLIWLKRRKKMKSNRLKIKDTGETQG